MKFHLIATSLFLAAIACSKSPGVPRLKTAQANFPPGQYALVELDSGLATAQAGAVFHWRLNGTEIAATTTQVFVPAHPGFDTLIAFHPTHNPDSILILCDLRADSTYWLYVNECCGGFDFSHDNDGFQKNGQWVDFQIKNTKKGQHWLGCFGNTAVLLQPGQPNVLTGDISHSPMHPALFQLYMTPHSPADLDTTICTVLDNSGAELGGFVPPEEFTGLWYVFLHHDAIRVSYDVKDKAYVLEQIADRK